MATREDIYTEQLKALGVYDPAFDAEIRTLAMLERRKSRAEKAWRATVPKGEKPSFLDPHYAIIAALEKDILTHRDALGLTPKGMRRLTGSFDTSFRAGQQVSETEAAPEPAKESATVLDFVKAKFGT